MYEVTKHPILDIDKGEETSFIYNGTAVKAEKGRTIATALHRAGYPVHSKSLSGRGRSLECGIGKCGACEMLVDGKIQRICITLVDGVKEVKELPKDFRPAPDFPNHGKTKVYRTKVAIIGAGPAGLAAREELNKAGIDNLVIDNNDKIGGQFLMQTHQFFFFEQEKKYGGLRGFDIATKLAGEDRSGILLDSSVFDILEGKRLAVKHLKNNEVYYVDAEHLVVAAGAIPFMPPFDNDDLPGVYTAAVVQKMMNNEFTLLGKNVLTVGAGNIGYLTSYQLMQAGANVKAVVEATDKEGGFPVQANRVRRLGIPIITGHILLEAVPNAKGDGIKGAVVAECENFVPIPGTEKYIDGIDAINICTGLVRDNLLYTKGKELFGRDVRVIGDADRIGEGTSAVLDGKKAAYEILESMNRKYDYHEYLSVAKEYIDSRQEPVLVIDEPEIPKKKRREKPFVIIDCIYGFACNPCRFACPHDAISKTSTSTVPEVDYDKCTGCMECVWQCPGLAIFGYNLKKQKLFLPIEYEAEEKSEVFLVNNQGEILGEGIIEKILKKPNKTNVARVKAENITGDDLMKVRGFIVKENYPEEVEFKDVPTDYDKAKFICHCEDITYEDIEKQIGNRKFISIDVIKHTTRLGMGSCRGKRCTKRLRGLLWSKGVELLGDPTPRGPMSNQITMSDFLNHDADDKVIPNVNVEKIKKIKTEFLIAGGGIAGSGLFKRLSEAGKKPVLLNYGRGSTWRNIMGGRPAFSLPELSDIATRSRAIFEDLSKKAPIDFHDIKYVTFAHNEEMYNALDASRAWSDAYMIEAKDFRKEISPYFNPELDLYSHALVTKNCWQVTPGKTVDLLRKLGREAGGEVRENTELVDIRKENGKYVALAYYHKDDEYIEITADRFVNALGENADVFARKLGIETGLYPVKHQSFITRRMPMLGAGGFALPMMIDRRNYKGFTAVYGQQLVETGQIIGCASPATDSQESGKNLKTNSREFMEIVSEVFSGWLPEMSQTGFQAVWSGYYVEPKMIVDPENGLFVGLRGQGYMLGLYLGELYARSVLGQDVPEYFERLKLGGDGLLEKAFK